MSQKKNVECFELWISGSTSMNGKKKLWLHHCKMCPKMWHKRTMQLLCVSTFVTVVEEYMYFPPLFQVISCSSFRFTPAAPTIVHSVLHTCSDWPVISIYTLRCLLSTIHTCGSIQTIHLSGLQSPIHVMPNNQKQSKGSSVPAEVDQTSSGDSGGNSAAVDQVFSMFKDFLEKTKRR